MIQVNTPTFLPCSFISKSEYEDIYIYKPAFRLTISFLLYFLLPLPIAMSLAQIKAAALTSKGCREAAGEEQDQASSSTHRYRMKSNNRLTNNFLQDKTSRITPSDLFAMLSCQLMLASFTSSMNSARMFQTSHLNLHSDIFTLGGSPPSTKAMRQFSFVLTDGGQDHSGQ